MEPLHKAQQLLLELLAKNAQDPLTIRELQNRIGASSPSVVTHHLKQLQKKGYLTRDPHDPRTYIVHEKTELLGDIVSLPLYGMAQCGPNGSLLDGAPVEYVPISRQLLGTYYDNSFMVKARGDSMEPQIKEGDLVIAVKRNLAQSGDIVVCVNHEKVLIKKYVESENMVLLLSLNQNYDPIIPAEDFRIEGVVKSVYSYQR